MKDEERLGYMLYRRDRDIIHGKPGVVTPRPAAVSKSENTQEKTEKDKEKKPFVDRVMKKALEHLSGQIKKSQARERLPELRVG